MRPYWTPFHQSRSVSREEGENECNRVLAEKQPGLSSPGRYLVPEPRGCRSHGGGGRVLRRAGQRLGPSPAPTPPRQRRASTLTGQGTQPLPSLHSLGLE